MHQAVFPCKVLTEPVLKSDSYIVPLEVQEISDKMDWQVEITCKDPADANVIYYVPHSMQKTVSCSSCANNLILSKTSLEVQIEGSSGDGQKPV